MKTQYQAIDLYILQEKKKKSDETFQTALLRFTENCAALSINKLFFEDPNERLVKKVDNLLITSNLFGMSCEATVTNK